MEKSGVLRQLCLALIMMCTRVRHFNAKPSKAMFVMSEGEKKQTGTQRCDDAEAPARSIDDLPAAAQRALKEAEERRVAQNRPTDGLPREINGRGGEDPARYGDWEVKGIAIDF